MEAAIIEKELATVEPHGSVEGAKEPLVQMEAAMEEEKGDAAVKAAPEAPSEASNTAKSETAIKETEAEMSMDVREAVEQDTEETQNVSNVLDFLLPPGTGMYIFVVYVCYYV